MNKRTTEEAVFPRAGRKTAMVIGGGRGIGRETALELARRGYEIILAARTKREIESACASIRELGTSAWPIALDITSAPELQVSFETIRSKTDRLHLLVNSAGSIFPGGLIETSPEAFQSMMAVNLMGVYSSIYYARDLLECAQGQVINIISRAGRMPYTKVLAYGCAKSGLVYLTRALSQELSRYGIRVNAVSPGAVATELRKQIFPDEDSSRLMAPQAVAAIICKLTEPEFSAVTGGVIDVPW